MKYMGSKNRIAKDILPIILKDRKDGQWYWEPFAGGMNVIDKVDGKRFASDKNHYLIDMWIGLQCGKEFPRKITKEMYDKYHDMLRDERKKTFEERRLIGWVGHCASFNGKFFEGYSGNYAKRDYIDEQIRNIEKQVPKLMDVLFMCGSYEGIHYPADCVIYCDIPYQGVTKYNNNTFEYDRFFDWCRMMRDDGNTVFVSEYNAPPDFECVWEKEITNSLNQNKTHKAVEKLFKV